MVFCSLRSVLICRWTTFLRLIAILFIYLFLLQVCLFGVITLCNNRNGPCIIFTSSSRQTYKCLMLCPFVFILPIFLFFHDIFRLPFYFLLPPVVPVEQFYIFLYFPALVLGLNYFSVVTFFVWDTLVGLLLVLFEPISLLVAS